jgi:hypothetical protein
LLRSRRRGWGACVVERPLKMNFSVLSIYELYDLDLSFYVLSMHIIWSVSFFKNLWTSVFSILHKKQRARSYCILGATFLLLCMDIPFVNVVK